MFSILSTRLDEALGVMQQLQQRDDNLYRVIMQADPVADALRVVCVMVRNMKTLLPLNVRLA